jgi:hypothetical protein
VTAGEFANAAGGNPISIYGPGYSRGLANNATHGYPDGMQGGNSYMTIVAIQNGLDYHIYSQVTLNMRISSFQRIF